MDNWTFDVKVNGQFGKKSSVPVFGQKLTNSGQKHGSKIFMSEIQRKWNQISSIFIKNWRRMDIFENW